MRPAPQRLELAAPHGRLECLLQDPGSARFAAAVCHPHPLYGGTMDNNVVYRIARAIVDAGGAALRFNFRGVGRSTGAYGEGVGEQDDLRVALDSLATGFAGLPLWVAGFSFGARVGLSVGARDARVSALLGVGLPLTMFDFGFLRECGKPKALVQAEDDEFGGGEEVEALAQGLPAPTRLFRVAGATHLFPGKLGALEAALAEAVPFLADRSDPR